MPRIIEKLIKKRQIEIKKPGNYSFDGLLEFFEGLREFLNDLWGSIEMIVTDTTNNNTGKTSDVIKRLMTHFKSVGFEKPLYVGCQHHILDRILKLCLDDFFR